VRRARVLSIAVGGQTIPTLLKPGELDTILQPWAKMLMATRIEGLDP
jgi:hypothetical protein